MVRGYTINIKRASVIGIEHSFTLGMEVLLREVVIGYFDELRSQRFVEVFDVLARSRQPDESASMFEL